MTAKWCVELLEDTIQAHGEPEIFNTDQGAQYTSEQHVSALLKHGIKISIRKSTAFEDQTIVQGRKRSSIG
jgi:putative transposase